MIIVICAIVFIVSMCRQKMEIFINFVLRLFAGAVGIYVINSILSYSHITSTVGLNGINILTVGALGLPGFILIYTVGLYFMFF